MHRPSVLTLLLCGWMWPLATGGDVRAEDKADFARDIRSIFANYCLKCHGPDEQQREAGLRLDTPEGAFAPLESGNRPIVAGKSNDSAAYRRMTSADDDERMPPREFGKRPSAEEIGLLKRWIDQGATWGVHWAYVPPREPSLPAVRRGQWPRSAIDYFTLAQMERRGLTPSPPADKVTLIRRLTFDLTGLPPTPAETDAFLADNSPRAYERLVERLLASPRYGERMALFWLDLARYADTHGYHIDSHRDMWRWRGWVINAFNANMPFDQFTVEQLAGDLLPGATLSQKIATGFNRNNMINFEGGAIADEYLNEYVVDRVVTTSTVWLAQTMRCSRCHDHKYDPFTQRDFYRLYAFFNNIAEQGLDGRTGNAEPLLAAPTPLQQRQRDAYARDAAELEEALARRRKLAGDAQRHWEEKLLDGEEKLPEAPADATVHFPLDETSGDQTADAADAGRKGRVEGEPIWLPGQFGESLLLDGSTYVDAGKVAGFERSDSFSYGGWVFPTTGDTMAVLARSDESADYRGYDLMLAAGKVQAHLVHDGDDNAIAVATKNSLPQRKWQHVLATYDGSGKAAGVNIYVDGQVQEVEVIQDRLTGSIKTDKRLQLGRRGAEAGFRGMLDDVRIYARELSAAEVARLAGSNPIREIVAIAAARRSPQQQETLRQYYLENHDAPYKRLHSRLAETRRRQEALTRSIPTTMVMRESEEPRETFVLMRGDYRNKGEQVTAGTPSSLPPLPRGAPSNRWGLAQWLVDPNNPLTARVTVNRYWQMYFGAGIVRTSEDFGTRGELPTHPALLDWLATQFVRSGWDVKQLQRAIVLSATYRQSSRSTPGQLAADPQNRWLARGPRLRLQAEMIRDGALFSSGLLHEALGGQSVSPYQPPGLWKEVSFNPRDFTAQVYAQGRGRDLYRRSMYTFWKRAVPPPSLVTFDAPDREVCTVRRARTNTPLQALVLLNDPTYVEAARALAERMMHEGGSSPPERITYAFRRVLARRPNAAELRVVNALLQDVLTEYRKQNEAARELIAVGDSTARPHLNTVELAAWTTVASVILNLSETITKE